MTKRLIALLSLGLTLFFAQTASAELSGGYRGVDAADGMRLEFSQGGGGLSGVLEERSGERIAFDADPLETGGETIIRRGGRPLYMLFTEEALGVRVITIPMTEERELITPETEALVFIRDGVAPPPKPARYVPPPDGPEGTIDPRAFVDSYGFWPPANVAYGYSMVRGRYRTLIRLHPVVQTDVLWRMCRSQAARPVLADALRGQGATCDDVLSTMSGMVAPGGGSVDAYNRFRGELDAEKAALVEAIRCSIDYKRSDPACLRAGERVAAAAVSLETVRSVLDRY